MTDITAEDLLESLQYAGEDLFTKGPLDWQVIDGRVDLHKASKYLNRITKKEVTND